MKAGGRTWQDKTAQKKLQDVKSVRCCGDFSKMLAEFSKMSVAQRENYVSASDFVEMLEAQQKMCVSEFLQRSIACK